MTNLPSIFDHGAFRLLSSPAESMFDTIIREFFNERTGIDSLFDLNTLKDQGFPKTDVYTDGRNVVFEAAVPFLDKETLKVTLDQNYLKMEGSCIKDEEYQKRHYFKQALARRDFYNAFRISDTRTFNEWLEREGDDGVEAIFKDGVIQIMLKNFWPEPEPEPEPKSIDVKMEE